MSTEWFLKHAQFLKQHYQVVSLSDAIAMLKAGRVSRPTVVLTFDDGYADNFVNLRAITERLRLPAVLFVSTEHVATGRELDHDVSRNQRNFKPLTWEQVRFLSRCGFEIGSHTRTHFDCGSNDHQKLTGEIVGSKEDLEAQLGGPVKYFSFPWGHKSNMSPSAIRIASATYPHIFSAYGGLNFPERGGTFRHLLRPSHPNDLWELEMALQSILDLQFNDSEDFVSEAIREPAVAKA